MVHRFPSRRCRVFRCRRRRFVARRPGSGRPGCLARGHKTHRGQKVFGGCLKVSCRKPARFNAVYGECLEVCTAYP